MQTRKLGNSGPEVSLVGLGTNNFGARIDFETARAVMHKALDLGITLIDTSDTLRQQGRLGGGARPHSRRSTQGHRTRDQIRHGDG